ncbi:6799_t:CDS:2 [Acaulospora colombiana]|uniref:6799_t:CDS:1 n=1 Tax=Acaulospora colombiana TaxID=27376 RepID=A0ACA9MEF9_9GLOM|nr:6799_t:CDS:2 [Acaulospora colombiana]
MLATSLVVLLSSSLLVSAQNAQLEVQSIDAQFDNAYLVPDLLASFDPTAYLTVSYGGSSVAAGSPLGLDAVQAAPTITVTPANSSVQLGETFTLAMVDPGAVGVVSETGPTRHWLVNGVTIGSNGALTVPATAITAYGENDPPHRYAIILWQQPASFTPPADLSEPNQPITQFDLNAYVSGWYFTCTRGTATAATSTSAVNTATLPAASSGSSTGTGSPSSSATHSTSSTGAALSNAAVAPFGVLASIAAAVFGIVLA